MDNLIKTKIKPEGIIFDFGFTLFHFENPSLERYIEIEYQGLNLVAEFLKSEGLFNDNQIDTFVENVKKQNRKFWQLSIKTKLEYPTAKILEFVLKNMKNLEPSILKKFLTTEILNKLSDKYHSFSDDAWIPFSDTKQTLMTLLDAKIKIAILSNARHHNSIINMLKKHHLFEYFNTIVTSAGFGKRKPNIEIFHNTLDKLGLSHCPESCLMIGDEAADMIGGKKAKLNTFLIKRSFKFPFEQDILPKYKPDFRINNISDLLNYIHI